jgi:hypothetical protein
MKIDAHFTCPSACLDALGISDGQRVECLEAKRLKPMASRGWKAGDTKIQGYMWLGFNAAHR